MSGTGRRSSSRGARRRRSARRRRGDCSRARWTARSPRPCPRPPRTRSPSPRRRSCEPARAPFVLDLGLRVARRRRGAVVAVAVCIDSCACALYPLNKERRNVRARVSPGGPVVPRPCPCPCLPRVCIFCEPQPCPAPALSFLSFLPRLFTLLSLLSPNSDRLLACGVPPHRLCCCCCCLAPSIYLRFTVLSFCLLVRMTAGSLTRFFIYCIYARPRSIELATIGARLRCLGFFWPACLVGYIVDWMQMRRGDARALFLLRLLSRVLSA